MATKRTSREADYNITGDPAKDAINKARAENVAAGRTASSGAGSLSNLKSNTITSASLAPAAPMAVTQPKTPIEGDGLAGSIDSMAQTYANSIVDPASLARSRTGRDTSRDALATAISNRSTKSGLEDTVYSQEVDAARSDLEDINNQILSEQRALQNKERAIEKNMRGATAEGINQEIRSAQKDSYQIQADLSIIQLARQNKYSSAKEIADRKVTALLEDEANEIQALQFTYNENKEQFTKDEQRQFETQQAERVRLLQDKAQELTRVNDLAIDALRNGAPTDVVRKMQQAQTAADAISVGGTWVGRLAREESVLRNQALRSQTAAATSVAQTLQTASTSVAEGTPEGLVTGLASVLNIVQPATRARVAPAIEVLATIQDFAAQNQEGAFTGAGLFGRAKEGLKGLFNMKSPEATANAQAIDGINLKVQQWASGASLTDQQTKQVNRLTPTLNDSDKQIREKINGLANFMTSVTRGQLLTEGIDMQFQPVNYFEVYDLYQKASPEQRKQIDEALKAQNIASPNVNKPMGPVVKDAAFNVFGSLNPLGTIINTNRK
jgi:hypothetical protein